MSHANISVFIPHAGCPNTCSFCNQRTISSSLRAPTAEETDDILKKAYERITDEKMRMDTEIAFFGGSFTAIDRDYMMSLLETAHKYINSGENPCGLCGNICGFRGIRISTRPDCIDGEILMLLKKYGVTAIELGAQSMRDHVLEANQRGHTADDVRKASAMIKEYGFELGLQMMVGLYKSEPADELYTMNEIISCRPDTLRIYPVAVLDGTHLAELYKSGEYRLYPFEQCVMLCADMLESFTKNGIRVIRLGLHAEESVEQNAVAGYYHPAFGEIVRSEWVKKLIDRSLKEGGEVLCEAPQRMMSILVGQKKSNRIYFADKNVSFRRNDSLPPDVISINGEEFQIQ